MEQFKEQVTVVLGGGNYNDIIKDHVYSCQSYGSRLGQNTRGCNTGFKSICRYGSSAWHLKNYKRIWLFNSVVPSNSPQNHRTPGMVIQESAFKNSQQGRNVFNRRDSK